MIVKLNSDTYRVQFIKVVEQRKRGKTTVQTICKIFKWGEKPTGGEGWVLFSEGLARQNPEDKYDHFTGKNVALKKAFIKKVKYAEGEEMQKVFAHLGELAPAPEIISHFDRVGRCVFANKLAEEFGRNG